MKHSVPSRRRFLSGSAGAGLGLGFLSQVPAVSFAAAKSAAKDVVGLRAEIEPLVRFLEDTPRERLTELLAARIRSGEVSYREVLGALLLAGARNIEPRPAVGFKFHAVLVVHSAHLASLSGPDSDRWLPILWAVDDFKKSQARDVEEGNWTMAPVAEKLIPSPTVARQAFVEAMDRWDEGAADAATVGLYRSAGAQEILDLFVPYAARDLRSIGHKAIYLANAWRTLQVMGWQHAEPVLRSLTYALLNHTGDPNPADNDLDIDRPWRRNEGLAADVRADWQAGKVDSGATAALMAGFRNDSENAASDAVLSQLNDGIAPQSVIDALFVGSAELMLRQPAIPALHAVTTTNAMHYLYQNCSDEAVRRRLLLQSASFLPRFRAFMAGRGKVGELRLDILEAEDGEKSPASATAVLAGGDRIARARKVLAFTSNSDSNPDRARKLIAEVRRRIFLKGTDAHHYKFSSAVLEDFYQVSPDWRARLLASSTQYLPSGRDNPLVERVRQAFTA
jgi:hypothetical protein